MRYLLTLVGFCTAIAIGTEALAAGPSEPPATIKRQVITCMSKSMSANKALSYNDAMKTCKDRLEARGNTGIRKDALAANAAVNVPAVKTP